MRKNKKLTKIRAEKKGTCTDIILKMGYHAMSFGPWVTKYGISAELDGFGNVVCNRKVVSTKSSSKPLNG